jgi:hypothetical protein
MFHRIQQSGVRRLVIDALGDLASAATDSQRYTTTCTPLVQHFAVSKITAAFLNLEIAGNAIAREGMQNAMSYLVGQSCCCSRFAGDQRTRRAIRILKTRGSAHDTRFREVEIGCDGIVHPSSDHTPWPTAGDAELAQFKKLADISRALTYCTRSDEQSRS